MKKHLILILLSVLVSSCHVGRFVTRNFSDITDYKFFDNQEIKKSDTAFKFEKVDSINLVGRVPKTLNINGKELTFEEYNEQNKTTAFLIIKSDSILYEKYFNGYTKETVQTSFSMAKSYVSALVGIALKEGKINSLEDPITNYINIFKNEGFEKIKIQDLLNMESGIKFNESYINPFGKVAKFYYGTNIKKYVSKLKIAEKPGRWNYRSVDTQVLGLLLEEVYGKPLAKLLEEKIWAKIGTSYSASWSLDSKKNKTAKAFCCINAQAIDYAKFGRLYLNDGVYNGEQVIPAEWVKESTTFDTVERNFLYKNQWWFINDYEHLADTTKTRPIYYNYKNVKDGVERTTQVFPSGQYFAQGHLGQYIFVDPEKDLIVVRLGEDYGKTGAWQNLFVSISRLY